MVRYLEHLQGMHSEFKMHEIHTHSHAQTHTYMQRNKQTIYFKNANYFSHLFLLSIWNFNSSNEWKQEINVNSTRAELY